MINGELMSVDATPSSSWKSAKLGGLAEAFLKAIGEPVPTALDQPILREFDWAARGVACSYILFMTGRCGSTWLTSLLRDTRLAGNPGEFFNAHVASRECRGILYGLKDYLDVVVGREMSNGRFGLEIDSERLRQIEALIEWPSVFPSDSSRSIFLYRANLPAQAWSWVSARKSGLWHVRANSKVPAPSVSEALPTELELIQEMVRIRKSEEYLQEFFERYQYEPYYLDYESLVSELNVEIGAILEMLSVSRGEISKVRHVESERAAVRKIQYTEKDSALSVFHAKHERAIGALRRNRFGVSSEELAELLSG